MTATCFATLAACDSNDNGKNIGALKTEKKYLEESTVNSTLTEQDIIDSADDFYLTYQQYYIFHSNGTGEYVYNGIDYESGGYIVHAKYTIKFKYTYVDDDKSAIACFYDSLENNSTVIGDYNTGNPFPYSFNSWSRLITVSNDVLCLTGTGYTFYVNEDYAKKLTNFNK